RRRPWLGAVERRSTGVREDLALHYQRPRRPRPDVGRSSSRAQSVVQALAALMGDRSRNTGARDQESVIGLRYADRPAYSLIGVGRHGYASGADPQGSRGET